MTTAAMCATRAVSWQPSFYRGEQYDSDLGLYYLRARYYNPATGRFLSRDPEDGDQTIPATLHKYLYVGGDPVNGIDPMGRAALFENVFVEGGSLDGPIENAVTRYVTKKIVKTLACIGLDALLFVKTPLGFDASWIIQRCLEWAAQ